MSHCIVKWINLRTYLLLQSHLDRGIGTGTTIRRPTRNSIDEETMQKVRTQLFMNQLNDAETGNVDTPGQAGATGGFNEPVLPPPN